MDLDTLKKIAGIETASIQVNEAADEDDDGLSPAEKELAKMGKGLSKKDEEKIDRADRKREDIATKKTAKEQEVEETISQFLTVAGISSEIIIEGEHDADVFVVVEEVIEEASKSASQPTLGEIKVFKDAVSAKDYLSRMKRAARKATVVGKKFA